MSRLIVCLALTCTACKGGARVDFSHRKGEGGKPVASWSGDSITDLELKTRFAEMSAYQRARYQTLEQKRDYVDGLARFELLAQEAQRRGLHNDPEVVETAKKVMVQRLLAQEMDAKAFPVSDERVKQYYQQHLSDFVKPAMTRLSHVFFKPEHKAEAEATLKAALALGPLDYAGFARLAREKSEEPRTQPIEGDLRFLSDDELAAQYGSQLVAAQKELAQVGMVLPRLVETPQGFHVVRLQGRQVELNLSVEQVKQQIQHTLLNEAKQRHYRAFLDGLKKSAGYQVDQNALGALDVDVKAPAVEAKRPPPGFVPAPEATRADK